MADLKKAGAQTLYYSSDGTTYTAITGKLSTDSEVPVEVIQQESTYTTRQVGDTSQATFYVDDMTDYSTLRGKALPGASYEEQYLAYKTPDGYVKTNSAWPIQVTKQFKTNRRDGLNHMVISVDINDDEAWTFASSITIA